VVIALREIQAQTAPVTIPSKCWWYAGAILVALHVALLVLSPRFSSVYPLLHRPVLLLVALEFLAGVAWLAAVWPPAKAHLCGSSFFFMLGVGLLLRGLLFCSTPMLEDDYWRYLWDGAVLAHGHSPYAHAPQEFLATAGSADAALLQSVARDGHAVLERINHPTLRTIYPPLAQVAFAAAHWLSPWSLGAWRCVLLFFDAATLALLLLLLRQLQLPGIWATIYWWNPLLVLEIVNAAHMDVLAMPLVLGALLLTARRRPLCGIALMSLAVGMKVWPVLLLPLLFRPLITAPRRLVSAIVVAAGILSLIAWPAVQGMLGASSGFAAYAGRWEMNDALFMGLLYGVRHLAAFMGLPGSAAGVARGITLVLLAAWILWLARRPVTSAADLGERMLLVIAGLFLLSPTQFPWYGLWMLPLLVVRPRRSLLLLMVLLALYHLRFYYDARDKVNVFDHGLVWLEYIPVWGFLLWEIFHGPSRTGHSPDAPALAVDGAHPA
jgi:hypothetical protein